MRTRKKREKGGWSPPVPQIPTRCTLRPKAAVPWMVRLAAGRVCGCVPRVPCAPGLWLHPPPAPGGLWAHCPLALCAQLEFTSGVVVWKLRYFPSSGLPAPSFHLDRSVKIIFLRDPALPLRKGDVCSLRISPWRNQGAGMPGVGAPWSGDKSSRSALRETWGSATP